MNRVNEFVVCRDTFASNGEFENMVRDVVMTLLKNNYIMTVRYDEPGLGIVCIDYASDDQTLGCPYPYWLTYEQAESIMYTEEE